MRSHNYGITEILGNYVKEWRCDGHAKSIGISLFVCIIVAARTIRELCEKLCGASTGGIFNKRDNAVVTRRCSAETSCGIWCAPITSLAQFASQSHKFECSPDSQTKLSHTHTRTNSLHNAIAAARVQFLPEPEISAHQPANSQSAPKNMTRP